VGDYRFDKKHGRGVYVYANTESYSGEYRNGKKHGQGTYRFKNGQEKRGMWSDDILMENPFSGIHGGVSMKSICGEQDEKVDRDRDHHRPRLSDEEEGDGLSVASSLQSHRSIRGQRSFTNLLDTSAGSTHRNSIQSPQRIRKSSSYLVASSSPSVSPNRMRSVSSKYLSDGSRQQRMV
jgi:hypothetical protein